MSIPIFAASTTGKVHNRSSKRVSFFLITKFDVLDLAMSTAVSELVATNPAHADYFSTILPNKQSLKNAYQWCSLPWLWLELEDMPTLKHVHVDTLLYTAFLWLNSSLRYPDFIAANTNFRLAPVAELVYDADI